jgi:hypothetical protein
MIAMADSSYSENSDASSAPCSHPTAGFTAPLVINVSPMVLPHPTPYDLPTNTIDPTKAKCETELLAHLEALADSPSTSDHLSENIKVAGDGITMDRENGKRKSRSGCS